MRAIRGHRADLQQLHLAGKTQNLRKGLFHQRAILSAKRANRVVIWMGVPREVSYGDLAVGGSLNPS